MDFQPDLSCPVCKEVFKEPVVLSCSHSFCTDCLKSWWREKPKRDCPFCKRRSSKSDPPRNLALRNLCEAYVQQREKASEEQVCQDHSEKLKLFCVTDQQLVCVVCRDSKVHENHRFRPIAEAAQDLRDEVDKTLLPLKTNLQKAKDLKERFEKITSVIKDQFHETERRIQAEFMKLHQFLLEEEESRMKALREEEEEKTQRMKDKMAAVSKEIEVLSESIRATEEQLRAPDVSFLLKYKAAAESVQHCPLLEEEPQLAPGALMDQAKHLGNLTFNIWTKMKRLVQFTPVILDPNTVKEVVLSDDLTSFTVDVQESNEESSDVRIGIACGSEGFDSGSHSWNVEVGDNDKWGLGVITDVFEAAFNKEHTKQWGLKFSDGQHETLVHNEDNISLKLVSNPVKIRVLLDCDKHEVSFYDLDANAHIHSFTRISQKKLFPIFFNGSKYPIRILPQKI